MSEKEKDDGSTKKLALGQIWFCKIAFGKEQIRRDSLNRAAWLAGCREEKHFRPCKSTPAQGWIESKGGW